MPVYSYDHIHLRTHDPLATAQYYRRMFDAKIVDATPKAKELGIQIGMTGRDAVELLLAASSKSS